MRPALPLALALLLTGCAQDHDPGGPTPPPPAQTSQQPRMPHQGDDGQLSEDSSLTTPEQVPEEADSTATTHQVCRESAAVEAATWVERSDGPSLQVVPSATLRACGGPWRAPADPPVGWESVLELAPDADTAGMREQYACHLQWASGKEVWHLEPWRPVVTQEQLVADLCNPGSPDPDLVP